MPPHSRTLADEGVALRHLPIVIAGHLQRDAILAAFAAARRPLDNLADLEAQIAANHAGARLVAAAMARTSARTFLAHMGHVQAQAAALVARAVAALPARTRQFADFLDDGTGIVATVTTGGGRLTIDFTGSAPAHAGNLNAPRAVTMAAVIYVIRALVAAPIPLNAGCLAAVDVIIPPGSILDPPPGAAVVARQRRDLAAHRRRPPRRPRPRRRQPGHHEQPHLRRRRLGLLRDHRRRRRRHARAPGAGAVHTHMTNTRITDPEILEAPLPGPGPTPSPSAAAPAAPASIAGATASSASLELLAPPRSRSSRQRRIIAPFGLEGGESGTRGRNLLDGEVLGAAAHVHAPAGARADASRPRRRRIRPPR